MAIRTATQPSFQQNYGAFGVYAPSRGEKTREFTHNVVPTAVNAGIQGLGAAGAQAAGASAAAGSMGSAAGALGTAAAGASIIGGVMGAASLAMNWGKSSPSAGASSGAAVGATIGTMVCPGIGTAVGAVIGAIGGGLIGCIKSGKHKDQKVRDKVRDVLVEKGIITKDYQIQLADGSLCGIIGKDGGPRAEYGGLRPYEVDQKNPLAKYAISWLNPLMELFAQGNEKIKTDFVGYFANAALSNAKSLDDVRKNVNSFMERFGVTNDTLAQGIVQMVKSGQVDEATGHAYLNGIDERVSQTFTGDTVKAAA